MLFRSLHKYEKSNQKEIKVLAQDGFSGEFGVMPPEAGYDKDTRNQSRGTDMGEKNLNHNAEAGGRGAGRDIDAGERKPDGAGYTARGREAVREPSAVNIFHAAELAEEALGAVRNGEPIRDEAVEAFRNSDTIRTEEVQAYETAAPPRGEAAQVFWQTDPAADRSETADVNLAGVPDRNGPAVINQAAELIRNEAMGVMRAAGPDQAGAELELEKPKSRGASKENIVEIPAPEYAKGMAEPVVIEPPEQSKASIRSVSQRQASLKERGTHREKAESEPDRDIVIRRILEEFMA